MSSLKKIKQVISEKAPPGWEGTVKKMKKHKGIKNPFALAWAMKNKGYHSHVKEDVSEAKIHPDYAKEILKAHNAMNQDFHALPMSTAQVLHDKGKEMKYRVGKYAPGSFARMFHKHLSRIAAKSVK